MKSKYFSFAEKQTFIFFTGFYFMQGALLIYLILTFLILPFFGIINPSSLDFSILAGIAIIISIFFPFLAFFLKEKNIKNNVLSILLGGLTYGTTDFQSLLGICDCLLNIKREWVPTNQYKAANNPAKIFSEAIFGVLLFLSPLFNASSLLLLPSSYLFAGKFLFVPSLFFLYDDQRKKIKVPKKTPVYIFQKYVAAITFFLIFVPTVCYSDARHFQDQSVEIKGKYLDINGKEFIVKGINYSPWRDGTGPNKNYDYPAPPLIEQDLKLISSLQANTILVYDPPQYVLDLAAKNDLWVIYTFSINWWAAGTAQFQGEQQRVLDKIKALKMNPNILAWELGNEVPTALLQKVPADTLEKEMKYLYQSVKKIDPAHLILTGNWPPTKDLKFGFFDITGFNVYPVWPPEVVAHGYGNYISQFLQPIAGNKPLLITEFGVNSLEAGEEGQARITAQCWKDLLKAGACGGIVFSFSDEWWKNYDNPVAPNQWWDRKPAPDDEKVHDEDPEEYYGILTSERKPKPAYFAVQKMYEGSLFAKERIMIPSIIVAVLVLLALLGWLWAKGTYYIKSEDTENN